MSEPSVRLTNGSVMRGLRHYRLTPGMHAIQLIEEWVAVPRADFDRLTQGVEAVECPRCQHPWAHHVCYSHGRGQCQCPDLTSPITEYRKAAK